MLVLLFNYTNCWLLRVKAMCCLGLAVMDVMAMHSLNMAIHSLNMAKLHAVSNQRRIKSKDWTLTLALDVSVART